MKNETNEAKLRLLYKDYLAKLKLLYDEAKLKPPVGRLPG